MAILELILVLDLVVLDELFALEDEETLLSSVLGVYVLVFALREATEKDLLEYSNGFIYLGLVHIIVMSNLLQVT